MTKISELDRAYIERNYALKRHYDGSYLRDTTNKNFEIIKRMFFQGNNEDTVQTMNVGSGLFTTISDIFSNYTGEPVAEDKIDVPSLMVDYVAMKLCCIGYERVEEEGKQVLKTITLPARGYFNTDGIDNILRFYQDDSAQNQVTGSRITNYYVFVQTFLPGVTVNKLYETSSVYDLDTLTEVQLDAIPQTRGMEEEMKTGLDDPAIVVIRDDENDIYPLHSRYEKVINQVYAMDRQKVMFDTQFLRNVESFILTKNIKRPQALYRKYSEGSALRYTDMPRIIDGTEDSSIDFINNTNELIKDAMENQKENTRQFSSLTTIPVDFLGMESSHGAIGKGSRSLLHGSFIKTIKNFRKLFDRYLPGVFDVLSKENGTDPSYTRPDVFAKSDTEVIEELTQARDAKLISRQRAIQQYLGLDEGETDKEIALIDEETEAALSLMKTNDNGNGLQPTAEEQDKEDASNNEGNK